MAKREVDLNQRLALLTILSAIFMPLTLLSGIWGMNFENMPELSAEGIVWNVHLSVDSCVLLPPGGVDRILMPMQRRAFILMLYHCTPWIVSIGVCFPPIHLKSDMRGEEC